MNTTLIECYQPRMQDEQRIIVGWIERVATFRRLTYGGWATKAKVAPTTLTRGTKADFNSVTTIPKLHALAKAANVPSVLDFLASQPEAGAVSQPLAEWMTRQVGEAIAKTVVEIVLDHQRARGAAVEEEPSEALVATIAELLLGLAASYRRAPQARLDPARTQGMLDTLRLQVAN